MEYKRTGLRSNIQEQHNSGMALELENVWTGGKS